MTSSDASRVGQVAERNATDHARVRDKVEGVEALRIREGGVGPSRDEEVDDIEVSVPARRAESTAGPWTKQDKTRPP